MRSSSAPVPSRGDVWEADLEPVVGDEMSKTRRVVLVGSDNLSPLRLKIVVPVIGRQATHKGKPWLVPIDERNPLFTKDVSVDCFQIRCLSVDRLVSTADPSLQRKRRT